MAIIIGELRENPTLLKQLGWGVSDGSDFINDDHPDNIETTRATREWIEQAGRAIEEWKCIGALRVDTGESILQILS